MPVIVWYSTRTFAGASPGFMRRTNVWKIFQFDPSAKYHCADGYATPAAVLPA